MIRVVLVDHLGTDLTVANALRNSYGKSFEEWSDLPRGERTRGDRELVEDSASARHFLPFRHPHVEVTCVAPLPIARQLGKHQVGMEWSEISRRATRRDLTFHSLDNQWRAPAGTRQGQGQLLPKDLQEQFTKLQRCAEESALEHFEWALSAGACLEQARFLLPQSMDVYWTWTGSLLAWAHLYVQRTHPETQLETQQFAVQVAQICFELFPCAWSALIHRLERERDC